MAIKDSQTVHLVEVGKQFRARDTHGQAHRAHVWKGRTQYYLGDNQSDPIEVVGQTQRSFAVEHQDQLLKWTFPTKRRDCLRITYRAIEKLENLTTPEFRTAWREIVCACPSIVARGIGYLYLSYLYPYHKNIQAHGRHLLMLKTYESKNEMHFWFIPLKEARELHMQSAEAMRGGVSLNDVQLIETYAVDSSFVLHAETFACGDGGCRDLGHHGNLYGKCTWVGGMAIHVVQEDQDDPVLDKSREFALLPDEALAELTEKHARIREKRTRKKANQKAKKAAAAAAEADREQVLREQLEAAAVAERKNGLLQPHKELSRLFASSTVWKR